MTQQNLLALAIQLATTLHRNQFDAQGRPYILHCYRVMNNLRTDDEELLALGILHDTIEDSSLTLDVLRDYGFSESFVHSLDCLSKRKKQCNEQYDDYKKRVLTDKNACLVKLADLEDNTDITRQIGITEYNLKTLVKYNIFYNEIKQRLAEF